MAPERHLLAMTTHHIAYDMWAREIFIFELGVLYTAFSAGRPSPLPEPEVQYVDYAHWQRQWLQGEVLRAQLDYWRGQLAESPATLDLPADFPRPPVQSYRGARQYLQFPPELARGIDALARRSGVTRFIVVLAAFQALLARYTGQERITVGSPIANRNRMEVEKIIGFLANTIVLSTDLAGDPPFRELLDRARETALGAYAHQDVPFELLVQDLHPERDMSRSPLFQVMFNYMLSYSAPSVDLPDLKLRLERLHSGAAQFDVNVDLWETPDGLAGVIEYCIDLFRHSTITRFVQHFRTLLASAVGAPETRLSELGWLTAAERAQALYEWNDTARVYGGAITLHGLFEAQAARTPDALAVSFEAESLTYRELDRRAGGLARRLAELGVGPEARVGVCMERSLDLMVALLAVLKAGGAYLPLDPDYPAERLGLVLADAAAPVVLVQAGLADRLPEGAARVLTLPAPLPEPSSQPVQVDPDGAAYVIYTSGSTGRPKGVVNTHRGIVNRLLWMQEAYALTAADVVLQKTPYSFDVSVW
jgi:non-ribosomal peptide synthetase component F